jgi:hypothetical protein
MEVYCQWMSAQLGSVLHCQVPLEALNGQWRLRFTTGNSGGQGSYFPVKAVQTFDVEANRIRNRLSLGPLGLYFDGGFIFDDKLKVTSPLLLHSEMLFDIVHLRLSRVIFNVTPK